MGCGQSTSVTANSEQPPLSMIIPAANTTIAEVDHSRAIDAPPVIHRNDQPLFSPLVPSVLSSGSNKEQAHSKRCKEDDLSSISSMRTEDIPRRSGSSAGSSAASSLTSLVITAFVGKVSVISRSQVLAEWHSALKIPEGGYTPIPDSQLETETDANGDDDYDPVEDLVQHNSLHAFEASHHEIGPRASVVFGYFDTEPEKDLDEVVSSVGSQHEWMYQLDRLEEEHQRRNKTESSPKSENKKDRGEAGED
jgi:hypothetical protein